LKKTPAGAIVFEKAATENDDCALQDSLAGRNFPYVVKWQVVRDISSDRFSELS
jgi:hypothetical protein